MSKNAFKFKCANPSRHLGYDNPSFTIDDEKCMATQMWVVNNQETETASYKAKMACDIRDEIVSHLCKEYKTITVDNEVIGEPRLAGTRFGVSDVLSAFCIYESIDEIIDEYDNDYTEKQLKDAVRFARDFLNSFYTS